MSIYIFDGNGYRKSLQLNILVSKEHLKKKISLLIHLTSKTNAVAKLENLCMFIKCKDGHIWETFYNFFEFLLKKSSLNLIGAQFYAPLVCKVLILNELRFLHSFSSRLISTNTKQTLIKSSGSKPSLPYTFAKGHANKCVKPLESPVQQTDVVTCDLKVLFGHESKQSSPNMTLKRKSINSEDDIKVKTMKVSHKFCKKFKCKCHERNKWKVFKQITHCSIVNYTDLIKTENVFDDSEFSQMYSSPTQICPISASLQVHENNGWQLGLNEKLSSKVRTFTNVELSLNSHQVMDMTAELDKFKTEKLEDKKGIEQSGKLYDTEKTPKMKSNKAIPHLENDDSNSQYYSNHNKKNSQEIIVNKQNIKSLNTVIAKESLRISVLPTSTVINTEPNYNLLQVPAMGFQSMSIKEHANNTDKLLKGFQSISSGKLNVSLKGFQSASKSDCNATNTQSMGFQTAAGKSLNISEKAFLAAQKMFDEVCSQEDNLLDNDAAEASLPNKPVLKKPAYPDENYQMDNVFNSEFADKFFEEIPFDDKEVESKLKVDVLQSPLQNLNSGKSQVGKVRKSLGGRRSLKRYALKK